MWCLALDNVRLGIDPRQALAGIRVANHADAAIADAADIDRVAQDAIVARCRPIDGAGAPFGAARRRDALCVQLVRDRARRDAFGIFPEDPADDPGLFLIDGAVPELDRSIAVDDRRNVITIAAAARHAPSADLPLPASADLAA
ncbi:hypothetical protein MU848_09150 [Sphingobium sp. MAH-33]|uniref:Uncharacterized protein n=1 Tax=Sphingobium agri TaxID=2933566 RepID=A0ABT0DXA5_9SPHN|nr:hypothetical protein [Sphingobium agri]MCK0531743.1 hypothetical protein [Sphingobium agri]